MASPVFVNSNSNPKVDSSERRAVTLNDKNMVTEEQNDNNYNIYDDPITLKELTKDQSPHQKSEFTNNSIQNSNLRLMTGVSGQGII